jgi:phosphoribosylanthranilate isomerase
MTGSGAARKLELVIKICGVTSPGDADLAVRAGADAIGVNLWPGSKRFVGDAAAAAVLAAVPPGVLKVGVFVNAAPATVAATISQLGLDRVQLHGDERPEDFRDLDPGRVIRAVRVSGESSFAELDPWTGRCELFLFDAFVEGFGGGGVAAPWELIARHARPPFLLAGGLRPETVARAITMTRPDGVDVASGVESSPGVKDPEKVRAFVAAARAVTQRP